MEYFLHVEGLSCVCNTEITDRVYRKCRVCRDVVFSVDGQ